jgi:hypothetical protein
MKQVLLTTRKRKRFDYLGANADTLAIGLPPILKFSSSLAFGSATKFAFVTFGHSHVLHAITATGTAPARAGIPAAG